MSAQTTCHPEPSHSMCTARGTAPPDALPVAYLEALPGASPAGPGPVEGEALARALPTDRPPRILLSGVFGPFGVDDEFGRKENIMELFHNQVTRGQGLASFRFHHRSYGLYFLAANVDADVTVLDFPTLRQFEREVQKGYDLVGISFIAPNFVKAREMARVTRLISPGAEIVLGGHGAAVEGVETAIQCDHVVRGEGIGWLRRHLGQDPDAPIVHPTIPASDRSSIMGIPLTSIPGNLLVPGVGCVNGCRFCSTSHFFGRAYTPFLSTGKEIFQVARRIADETGTDEFFVQDENFLKDRQRAMDLIDEMERHGRYFSFHLFSSAETILAFGIDNLERLGVTFLWIGVESSNKKGNYEKNNGVDARKLVAELRSRGIIVLASGILCSEHHTVQNIQAEIDFMVGLNADFVQFMLLIPLPVTALYKEHKRLGILRTDLPLEEWHGQKYLSYNHPEFPGLAPQRWIDHAFRQEYEVNSSSLYRVTRTVFAGYRRLAAMESLSPSQRIRRDTLADWTRHWAQALPTVMRNAVNAKERARARELERQVRAALPPTAAERLARRAAIALAFAWKLRVRLRGDGIQPITRVTHYVEGQPVKSTVSLSPSDALGLGGAMNPRAALEPLALRPLRAAASRLGQGLVAAASLLAGERVLALAPGWQ